MNCERAEGYLSAFLDDALDPRLSQQVRAHVEECAHCRAILDDYRSFDHLLATTARIEPPESLRARIFDSDEYRRILAERDLGDQAQRDDVISAEAGHILSGAGDLDGLDEAERAPADTEPDDLILPDLAEFPEFAPDLGELAAESAEAPPRAHFFAFARVGSSVWSKVLLPAAAVLTLTLGAALLLKQGFVSFSTTTAPGLTSTLGNPAQHGIPLAAGSRVVYLHDGILWSAPEVGPGIAQPLTPSGSSGVTVGAWSVAPGGQLVAYVDLRSGSLHIVRSDGLSDHVAGTNAAGGLAWSPDATHIAYLTGGGGGHVLHVVKADGTGDLTLSAPGADAGNTAWSDDSLWLAYTQTRQQTTAVWSYSLAANTTHQLAAQADAADSQANVAQLAWLPDTHHPAVTWATSGADGSIEGIYSQNTNGTNLLSLTPSGARYTSAAYSDAHAGGAWLVADGSALTLISAANGSHSVVATLDVPASRILWSATGAAAVTHGNTLSLWSSDAGLVTVDTGLGGLAPVWSTDGSTLLYAKSGSVELARVSKGRAATQAVMQTAEIDALGIAPDRQSIAVVTSGGVVLTTTDGAHAKLVDHHTPQDGTLAWSVAG